MAGRDVKKHRRFTVIEAEFASDEDDDAPALGFPRGAGGVEILQVERIILHLPVAPRARLRRWKP